MPVTPFTMVRRTLFVATDSDTLDYADDITSFQDTAQDALDAWLEHYSDPPKYIFNVRVIQRAEVVLTQTTIKWETESDAS